MPSGHRPTREPGRVSGPPPAPPTGPAGASPTLAAAIVAAADALTAQVRRIADALEPAEVELAGHEEPTPADDVVHDELWSLLDWTFWGAGMGDVLREPLADAMTAAITPEQRADALRVMAAWHASGREPVGRRAYEALKAERDRLLAEVETADRIRAETQRDRDQHAAVLGKVLGHFIHKGHPGEPCLQTGWISEKTVAQWRSVVAPTVERPWWEQLAEERSRADAATMRAERRARTVARIRGLADRTQQGQWIDPAALRFILDTPEPEPAAADDPAAESDFVDTYADPNLIGPADRTG